MNIDEKHITATKTHRKNLDAILQDIRRDSETMFTGEREPNWPIRDSRERSLAITKLQEAIMWLGMDLKSIGATNPYPNSYNPSNAIIDPTADGLKL